MSKSENINSNKYIINNSNSNNNTNSVNIHQQLFLIKITLQNTLCFPIKLTN